MPKVKLFKISRRLYTNPEQHDKECKERISRLHTQLAQTGLKMDLVTYTDVSPFYFDVELGIERSAANKRNICKIGEILTALSEEDPHVYYRIYIDDEVWFMDVFRNRVFEARALLLASDCNVDGEELHAKHQSVDLLEMMLTGNNIDEIKEMYIYSKEDFDAIMHWDEDDLELDEGSDITE